MTTTRDRAGSNSDQHGLRAVIAEVAALRDGLLAAEAARADVIAAVHPLHQRSAANLVHYVQLRNQDVRDLQSKLGLLGLSSLGRAEPYVLATVEAVLAALASLAGEPAPHRTAEISLDQGHELLTRNADRLLGAAPAQRTTRIMVTLPSEAAEDEALIARFIAHGMDVARVNCAHDNSQAWGQMIASIRAGVGGDGRHCRIAMDLGGPKLRTGPLLAGPRVVRIRPRRDQLGRVALAARVWLSATEVRCPIRDGGTKIVEIPVGDLGWVKRRRRGDVIGLRDSRGSRRHWTVIDVTDDACMAAAQETAYVTTGLQLSCRIGDHEEDSVEVAELPEIEQAHQVQRGDRIVLTRSLEPALPSSAGTDHYIGCSLPEAFDHARAGERVWLDDGKIGGVIGSVTADEIVLAVTDIRPAGAKLRAGKGINMPDTDLRLDSLTSKDLEDLGYVAHQADMVNLSFVRRPEDIEQLQRELSRLDAADVGIVLKIENAVAFDNLPELLLTAMRSPRVGVMIARGDLAVEVGFERMAEVQEEIMWACEAAHVPVIWATQVLDTLAQTGQPSRAEVTDAAMSQRAECVMLNKGPYITEAISALDSILTRMLEHQDKKRSLLRQLRAWDSTAARDLESGARRPTDP
jgi:pyruvate kinase